MARRAHMALLLVVPALAVAGCGGDSSSKTSATGATTGQQGATRPQTGGTGTTGATGTARARRPTGARLERSGTPKREDDEKSATGGSDAGTPAPAETSPEDKPKEQALLTPKERKQVGRELKKQAHVVCRVTTLEVLAEQYEIKDKDVDEVARAYAATYPAGVRKAVAAGCKGGLLESSG